MNKGLAVWRKEMTSCLVSPFFYGIAVVFLAVTGLNFWKLCVDSAGVPTAMSVLLFGPLFFWIITLALITALTMRLFAEEARSGTLELLMTAPLRDTEIVLGKFAAALTLFALIVLPVVSYPWILRASSAGAWSVDKGQVATGFLGVLLMGSFYSAVGLLISALARGPVLAALASFSVLNVLFFMDAFWYAGPSAALQQALDYCSAVQHATDFARGLVDSRALVLYASGTALSLFLAVKVVEARRWR